MCGPGRSRGLLIQVHAKHIWATEFARLGDQALPRRMMAQDLANNQLASGVLGFGNDTLRLGQ